MSLAHLSRDGAAAARVAHNHEVPGSSPGPATKKDFSGPGRSFLLLRLVAKTPWSTCRLVT